MTFLTLSLFFLSPFITLGGHATPFKRATVNGGDEQPSSAFPTSVWIPIVIVGLILVAAGLIAYSNKKIRALILPSRPAPARTDALGRRELTADELAGTINTGAANANGGAAAQPAARTRRTRRPRRTPSQMSVTSLPAYNKEPGEQELVIFRGIDAEDASLPLQRVDEPDDDEDSSNNSHARQMSESTISSTDHDHTGVEQDGPTPSRRNSRRASSHHDLPHSSEESQRLMHNPSDSTSSAVDDRGEAPPYFEVIEEALPQNPPAAVLSSPNSADNNDINSPAPSLPSASSLSPPTSPERRSGIRTFFNRMQTVGAPRGLGHARGASAASTSTLAHDPGSSSTPSRIGHRNTPSTASSFFRTISRQRSQSSLGASAQRGLTSPSLISLNSISSPLTHTLTRTEFTYPKDGPTPEQLKIISSRESIARFGVPYGPDALAFASTSMLDIAQPPPDFETAVGASTTSLVPSAAGASRTSLHIRGDSNGARMPSPLAQPAVARQESTDDSTIPRRDASSSPVEERAVPASAPATGSTSFNTTTTPEPQLSEPTNSDTMASRSTATTMYKSLAPSMASRFNDDDISEFGFRVSKSGEQRLSAPGTQPTSGSNSHLHGGTARSESRASVYSHQSFATANESIATRGRLGASSRLGVASDDDDDEGGSGAGEQDEVGRVTPRVGTPVGGRDGAEVRRSGTVGSHRSRHAREETDATVTEVQGSVSAK